MNLVPTQITFHGLAHSDALETAIRERVAWLQQFYTGVAGCRVLVEVPHRHRRDGRHVHVHVVVTVRGGVPIVVSHEPSKHAAMQDSEQETLRKDSEIEGVHRYAGVAVRQAFDATRRRLQDFAREQRGSVKTTSRRTASSRRSRGTAQKEKEDTP